jgi:hypothetical protein
MEKHNFIPRVDMPRQRPPVDKGALAWLVLIVLFWVGVVFALIEVL